MGTAKKHKPVHTMVDFEVLKTLQNNCFYANYIIVKRVQTHADCGPAVYHISCLNCFLQCLQMSRKILCYATSLALILPFKTQMLAGYVDENVCNCVFLYPELHIL